MLGPMAFLRFTRIERLSWALFELRRVSGEWVVVLLPDLCFELRVSVSWV